MRTTKTLTLINSVNQAAKTGSAGLRSKSGFTLMELMVYCGLIGIVVLVAGQAYSDSAKFRVRSEAMTKSSAEANAAATLLQDDLMQMGAKSAFNDYVTAQNHAAQVYLNPTANDHSSFFLNNARDSIVFRKVTYLPSGEAEYAQQVSWYKQGNTLFRSCSTMVRLKSSSPESPADCPAANDVQNPRVVRVAEGIESFSLEAGRRLQDGRAKNVTKPDSGFFGEGQYFTFASRAGTDGYQQLTVEANQSTNKISGFASNYEMTEGSDVLTSQIYMVNLNPENPDWLQCLAFTFEPRITYGVAFKILAPSSNVSINQMRNFQAGIDHIGVGFREKGSGEVFDALPDNIVYPAQTENDLGRYFEFSVADSVTNACLVFTFALYSPSSFKGWLNISDVSIFRRDGGDFDFTAQYTNAEDKVLIKAFRLKLDVKVKGEITKIEKIIPTPNNGTEG